MAEIHPTELYSEKPHRGSVPNAISSVGADGTGRYPDFEWARKLDAPIWVEPRKL